jgi:hypothetical protein
MTCDEVVEECRDAFADEAPAWPAGLIRFLDQPPDVVRVFAYVIGCTRHLLATLGEATPDLEQQLELLQSYVKESIEIAVVRETLGRLWVRRSPYETAKTAVVQLFGSLLRYREGNTYRHLACTVSITMLVGAAQDREQAFEAVLQNFIAFVSGRAA